MKPAQYFSPRPEESLGSPDQLLKEYLPLIRYHAGQLHGRVPDSIEWNDLINAGVMGLLDAAKRFDPGRNIKFCTFIAYRVRGAMIDYLRAFDWFPRALRDTAKELQQVMQKLENSYGRPAEEDEIAKALGITITEYRHRLNNVHGMSIVYFEDMPAIIQSDDTLEVMEIISDHSSLSPDRQAAMTEFMEKLATGIEALPQRERILLTLYYYEELNMKEVALILGVTESRVSQIHNQMVLRLRSLMKLEIGND